MDDRNAWTDRITGDTVVGEALALVPGADAIFERHGCSPRLECLQEHLEEYSLVDLSLTCHIADTDALVADLRQALAASTPEQRAAAPERAAAAEAPRARPAATTEGTEQRPSRRLAAPTLRFDLAAEIASLEAEESWRRGDRNARTLVQERGLRITLAVLQAGVRLHEHRTHGPASLQVIAGHLRLVADGAEVDLPAGSLLALEQGLPHTIEARDKSAFLITLA